MNRYLWCAFFSIASIVFNASAMERQKNLNQNHYEDYEDDHGIIDPLTMTEKKQEELNQLLENILNRSPAPYGEQTFSKIFNDLKPRDYLRSNAKSTTTVFNSAHDAEFLKHIEKDTVEYFTICNRLQEFRNKSSLYFTEAIPHGPITITTMRDLMSLRGRIVKYTPSEGKQPHYGYFREFFELTNQRVWVLSFFNLNLQITICFNDSSVNSLSLQSRSFEVVGPEELKNIFQIEYDEVTRKQINDNLSFLSEQLMTFIQIKQINDNTEKRELEEALVLIDLNDQEEEVNKAQRERDQRELEKQIAKTVMIDQQIALGENDDNLNSSSTEADTDDE